MPFPDFTPTIPELLHRAAARFGAHPYLVVEGERLSYADAERRSAALAKGMLAEGIGKGARVGLLMPNSVDFAIAAFAVARVGALFVPVNTFSQTRELGWTIGHADLTHLVAHPRFLANDYLERLEAALPGLAAQSAERPLFLPDAPFLRAIHVWGPSDRTWSRGDEAEMVAAGERAGIDDEFLARVEECVVPADPALIVYSSGSTADPKGAIHTQGTVVRHSCNLQVGYPMGPDDVMFSSMPFFWIGGLITTLFAPLHLGATLVTESSFEPGTALDLIEQERATIVTGWPQQGKTMAEHPSYSPERVASVVRTSMPDLVPAEHRPPPVNSTSLGMTEMCSSHTLWDQYDPLPESRRGTFGKPLPGIAHKVVDPDTGTEVPIGDDGELWARGYSLMQGLQRREREDVFEPDGWYRTGDAGHFDADGWFYFTGRLGEMIKTPGGANVTPAEVEAALMAYPDVLEAYVTGIPAEDGSGQLVVGAVVPRGDGPLDADELRARLKGDLSAYKVPKHLWVCAKSELPFLQSGKIKKQELGEQLAARFFVVSDTADVLIIGAGASGGVAALRLARAGMRVVCLEQGEWHSREEYPGAGPDWELLARKQWTSSPNVRRRPADYPIDLDDSDMVLGNFNGVGGGTILYSAVWPRLLPSDFHTHADLGIADDWPLSYAELLPFYEETDRQFGVSGLGGNPAYPASADPPLPPLPIGRAGLALARAHARLGWHWWPEYNAILSADRDDRHACVQRGTCGSGCNEGAKGSTDVTHWPGAIAAGARLVTGARVRRIEVDATGRACGATWLDPGGQEHFQAADVVLLAANGIGTARLLLLSAHAGAPDGLANSSGLVGRRLMVHPGAMIDGYFDDELRSWQGHFGGQIQSLQFAGTDPDRGFLGGTKWSLAPTGGPLAVAFGLRGRPALGAQHHEHMRTRFGRGARWVVLCEDLPDRENRVELSPTLVDGSGIPAPKVTYRVSEDARRATAWSIERATESLTTAGAHTIDAVSMRNNSHLLGTARMGDDRATSVVDRWGRAHDVPNVAVIDGSVFVTVGAANPTSTICALALRAVDHLLAHRSDVRPPEPARHFATPRPAPGPAVADVRIALSDDDRSRLRQLARVLIPGDADMPAADVAGGADTLLDRVLDARPDLADDVKRAAAPPFDDPDVRLRELRGDDRAGYHALVLTVLAAYYRSPDVRARLGYPGQEANPVGRFEYPEYLAEGLLDHLIAH